MRNRLLTKLLVVNLPVIALAMGVVWVAIDTLAADYFRALMAEYDISPARTHAMFVDAVRRYLLGASIVAAVLAVLLSFLLTRRVLAPLRAMQQATRRLAAGDYDARVPVVSGDELGDLGEAFNRMADSLEHIEALRRRMVADLAHELRTPLTNLRGYMEAFADGVIEPSRDTLDMLQDELLRLQRLVDDLHALSEVDAAGLRIRRQAVDVRALLGRALALERGELEARRLEVALAVAPEAAQVSADPDRLAQVVRNLLRNAIQFTPAGGRVRLAAERRDGQWCLAIGNSGVGIAAADLPHVFERFYRGDKSRSRARGGSGIGLAIVKGLVEAHGGRVEAESRDGWTCFRCRLPDA